MQLGSVRFWQRGKEGLGCRKKEFDREVGVHIYRGNIGRPELGQGRPITFRSWYKVDIGSSFMEDSQTSLWWPGHQLIFLLNKVGISSRAGVSKLFL